MQRALVILTVILVVLASLAAGALAAHWTFWNRAWQWQVAAGGWPEQYSGPQRILAASSEARPLSLASDPVLTAAAVRTRTQVLVRARGDQVQAWFAAGLGPESIIDGRDLTAALLVPLYAQLVHQHPGILDARSGQYIPAWQDDERGAISPRQLFWQLSGMPAGTFRPLDPFNARAQLASGPDFARAARRWQPTWPPGSHFEESPVNWQLLAQVAAGAEGMSFADLLEQRVWSRIAAADATLMLDHIRGDAAAHCCMRAAVADWLRLGLQLAEDDAFAAEVTLTSPVHAGYGLGFALRTLPGGEVVLVLEGSGRLLVVAPTTGRVLLWIGEGRAPDLLESLLPPVATGELSVQ